MTNVNGNSYSGNYANDVNSNYINNNNNNIISSANLQQSLFNTAQNLRSCGNSKLAFSTIDADGNGSITQNEYEDYYVGGKEALTGTILREGNPDLAKYRKEAKNLFESIAQKSPCVGTTIYDKDGKAIGKEPVNAINQSRYNATVRVLNKFGKTAEQRTDIIKNEGPQADIFNGKTLGELIDQEQTRELNQGNSYKSNISDCLGGRLFDAQF